MHLQSMLLTLSATALLAHGYKITGDGVNCRSGPSTSDKVIKSYPLNTDVDIACQTAGTDIFGDSIWDKTGDGCYVADYYVKTGTTGYVKDKCDGGSSSGGNGDDLPGLKPTQSSHAWAIMRETKNRDLGRQGCLTAITTALVETELYIYANTGVAESLKYPHDLTGNDYDSVGIFQQRVKYYPDVAADMDPAKSAGLFFDKMVKIPGWETEDVGELCQDIQVSGYPEKYPKRVPEAEEICKAGGF